MNVGSTKHINRRIRGFNMTGNTYTRQVASLGIALTLCLLFIPGSSVYAQGATLEEIVVTAQKREESLQTVPVTMQAFTGEQLDSFNILNVTDIAKLAPNLNVVVQNAMSHHIVIRGVGTNEFFGNAARLLACTWMRSP